MLEAAEVWEGSAKSTAEDPAGKAGQENDGDKKENSGGGAGFFDTLGLLGLLGLNDGVKETIVLAVHKDELWRIGRRIQGRKE
jgi:hypothetical protein